MITKLMTNDNQVKMDSREIAELTGKRHSNVLRDINNQFRALNINGLNFESVYFDKKNQERICYKLDYDQTMILITGYSTSLRAKVVKRWRELESHNVNKIPSSYSEALLLASNQAKKIEEQQNLIIEQTPKAEFYDMVAKSDKWLTLKQVSDVLNIPEIGRNNLCKILRDKGLLTRYNQPYQKYKKQGLFKSIISVSKGGHTSLSTVVSPKGLNKIKSILLGMEKRDTAQYRYWRLSVFKRDFFTCQSCGYDGDILEAHHLIPWSKSVEKRFDIDNGVTLCKRCHKELHSGLKEDSNEQ